MSPIADALRTTKATAGDKKALAFLKRKRKTEMEEPKKEEKPTLVEKAKAIFKEKTKQADTKQIINKNEKSKR